MEDIKKIPLHIAFLRGESRVGDDAYIVPLSSRLTKHSPIRPLPPSEEGEWGERCRWQIQRTKWVVAIEKIKATTENIGADSQLVLACYLGNQLCYAEPATVVEGQTEYYFLLPNSYTTAKIVVLENFDTLYPITEPVFVE